MGRTDLMVTPICFGTSGLGDMPDTYGYAVDADRARATMHAIFDGPVNFIDTSRIYGFGRSEERIGAAIRERGGLPEGFVISTKLDRDPETNVFDAARARRSLERSLKALGLARIDLLHLHDPEHSRSLEEATARDGALGELFRMREKGLAKAVGLAAGPVDMMMPLLRDWDFDALITHNRFTLANRNAEAMLDFAKSKGIASATINLGFKTIARAMTTRCCCPPLSICGNFDKYSSGGDSFTASSTLLTSLIRASLFWFPLIISGSCTICLTFIKGAMAP